MSDYLIHSLNERGTDGVAVTANGGEPLRCCLRNATTHVHDGMDPDAAIAYVLAHPEVVEVHSRNLAYGCYMMRVTRR